MTLGPFNVNPNEQVFDQYQMPQSNIMAVANVRTYQGPNDTQALALTRAQAASAALGVPLYIPPGFPGGPSLSLLNLNGSLVPQAFGATGNGTTDDTAAILAANTRAALTGAELVFPPGTYIYSQELAPSSGVRWRGVNPYSSILKQANGANLPTCISVQNATNGGFFDLGLDFNCSNNAGTSIGYQVGQSGGNFCTAWHTIGCVFQRSNGFAIAYSGGPSIANDHCIVARNRVFNCVGTTNDMVLCVINEGLVYANTIQGINSSVALQLYECNHLTAWGNDVEIASGSNQIGVALQSLTYANVFGNRVLGPGTSQAIAYQIVTEHDNVSPQSSQRNKLADNIAYNCATGIYLLETNYDEIHHNRLDTLGTGFSFPSSAHAQAGYQRIKDNSLINVTTPVGNAGGGAFAISNYYRGNDSIAGAGYINPNGIQSPPGVPASGAGNQIFNPFSFDCMVSITAGAGSTCQVFVGGSAVATIPASGVAPVSVPWLQPIYLVYTSAPTWTWYAL